MGLKVVISGDTTEHPISIRIYDTPGDLKNMRKAAKFVFKKADLIIVVLDGNQKPYPEILETWNEYVISQIFSFHLSTFNPLFY